MIALIACAVVSTQACLSGSPCLLTASLSLTNGMCRICLLELKDACLLVQFHDICFGGAPVTGHQEPALLDAVFPSFELRFADVRPLNSAQSNSDGSFRE